MSSIFINYRNGPHALSVEALHEHLARHFGADQVFLDKASLEAGDRYPDELRKRVEGCDVFVVVIDDAWLTATDDGIRMIDRERDWVREEIEIALRAGKVVVPVLIGNAVAPKACDLRASIAELAHRQAREVRPGRFPQDVRRLVEVLERHTAPRWEPPGSPPAPARRLPWRWLQYLVGVLAAVLFIVPSVVAFVAGASEPEAVAYDVSIAAGVLIFLQLGPLLGAALTHFLRRRVYRLEREFNQMPPARYNTTFARPLMYVTVLFLLLFGIGMDDGWRTRLPIMLVLMGIAIWRGLRAGMRMERNYDEAEQSWPGALPARPHKQDIWHAVSQLRSRLASWGRPLTRQQRDRTDWAIDQLHGCAVNLWAQARQSRRGWLAAEANWWGMCPVLAAGTVGVAMAAVSLAVHHGFATVGYFRVFAVEALVAVACCWATLELSYRAHRWAMTTLATEIDSNVTDLRGRAAGGSRGEPDARCQVATGS